MRTKKNHPVLRGRGVYLGSGRPTVSCQYFTILSRSLLFISLPLCRLFPSDKYVDPDDGQPRPGDDYRTIDLPAVMDLPKTCMRAREAIKTEEFCNISLRKRLATRPIFMIIITVFVRMRMFFVVFKLTPFNFNISRNDGTVIKKIINNNTRTLPPETFFGRVLYVMFYF